MDVKSSEKKVFKKLRPINAKFFKKLGDEGRKSIKNAFDSLQAEKQIESSLNIYASNNNSVSETYEQNHEVKKVPGERKILVQKVEIVFPPRRVSHYFDNSYQLNNQNNESTTYDNYCDTVPSTEIPSGYDDTAISEATEPTVDDTLTNSDETKNKNLEQHLLDIPDTSINPTETIIHPSNTLKFISKCPENRSNNILPLKMKRIIRKPKIILRTSRFGRTQVLNAPQQLPVVENIPINEDTTTRLDEATEIEDIKVENVVEVGIPEECYKHSDIQLQEQVPELVLGIKNEETQIGTEVDLVEDIQSEILDPPPNIFNEEFYGFELDEKMDSEADVQIKHLEKVLQKFNNFQDDLETTSEWIEPDISDTTEAFIETQTDEIQTKVLHNFTFKKDDIEKLDETLKVISLNLSSCAVVEDLELENIKLKLIVKHLMGKLQVNSLQETFEFDDEDVMDITEDVVECEDAIPLVTEEAIDATMHEEDVPEIINHLTNSNDGMMDTIQVKVNDNIRKRRLSKCEENIETMTKMCRTITVLEEETLENSDKIDLLETTSTHNSLFGSPLSSRRNSADSIISAVSTEINDTIVEPMTSTVLVEDINESTIVESINNSTLVESITQEPSLKEKKATSGSSSKVEKQTLKRSSKDKKESSRQSSIESSSKEKKDKKNLVQSKLCFTKQIDDKKGTVVTSTPLKNLRRSSRSESTSSTNKNEMIRFDYLKDKTPVKDVKHSTDFCKAMEELNVIKKTKKSKLVVNDVKPISTARAQRSRSRNRSRCEDNLESITKDIPLPAEQKPVVSKVKKVEKKSKESTLKSVVEKGLNKTNEIIKETSEKLSPKLKKERKSVAPLQQVLTPPIFATEVLEKAIEKLVPYDEILTVLRYASHVTTGRPTLQEKAAIERKRNETKKLLGKLKYFHCGNCQKDVTKQKWKDHLLNHGGLAWIDGFEKAIDLNDWEGSLRRFVNNMKIYKIPAFVCPLCSEERKSALGQLSHVILCGFDEETVEGRKKKCSTCDATMYPFNYAYHKKTCIGRVVLQSEVEAEEIEDEPVTNVLDSSGRVKRKAVQKAEKRFKSMLKVFTNPLDNLKEKNGVFKCRLCVQTFKDQETAINHIKTEHETAKDLYEDDDTSSDASVHDGSSSEDGSSGDEESEVHTNSEEDLDNLIKSNNNSRKRAPRPLQVTLTHDSHESTHVRMAIFKVVADLRKMQKISTVTFKWTSESYRKNWINEVFPELLAATAVNPILDAKSVLQSLNFKTNSMKFTHKICTAVLQFEHQFNVKDEEWEQLEFANVKAENQGVTMFCGGQVSSLDWSPSKSNVNFLAVACNNDESRESNQMVTQTQKSIVQIFQFNNLTTNVDENANCCKLKYAFVVDDGPVWSVKFCSTGEPTAQRIGLLAVSTAVGDVLIYALPNVMQESSSLLHLEASVVCKVKDDMIFNDIFNQACELIWFHNCNNINLLTAGFLDGTVAIWDMNNMKSLKKEVTSNVIYPSSVVAAHIERITALDIRSTDDAIYLITSSLDRKVRTFYMTETNVLHEVSNYQCKSRLFCAKWWQNWPSVLLGQDDCFTPNALFMRNPYEFSYRYHSFYSIPGSIMDIAINNYQNTAMFVTDSGDVVGYKAQQLISCPDSKFKEKELKFHSFTDFSKITTGAPEEIGVIFCDLKDPSAIASRKRRNDDFPYINNLQINQICFNRNEENNQFYALGYANGFVRVRFLSSPK